GRACYADFPGAPKPGRPSKFAAIGFRGATCMGAKRAALMAGAALAALAIGASAAPVYAADQGPADGTGYHAGSFWFLQEYEFGGFYDSNVFATPNDP